MAFVATVTDPAMDAVSYARSYASGHVRAGLWTEDHASRFVEDTTAGWLNWAVKRLYEERVALIGIVGVTVTLLALQRKIRRSHPEQRHLARRKHVES